MTHVHMSLKHGLDDAVLAAHVRATIAKHKPRSFSTTEAAGFRAGLRVDGYVTVHNIGTSGQAESAILVRQDALGRALAAVLLSALPVPRRGGQRVHATPADLDTGRRILAVHMPSGVEAATGFRRGGDAVGQVAAYRDAIGGLRRYVATHPQVDEIYGDWNLHAGLDWVRAYFAEHFPDFVIVAPRTATHAGGRVIDWALIRKGHGRHAASTEPNPVSDHETVIVTRQETAMANHPKTDAFVAACRRRGVEVLLPRDWGSAHPGSYLERIVSKPHSLLPANPVDTLWNHITVTRDDGTLLGDFKADMREVERIGDERFGSGFPYNVGFDQNADRPRLAIGQYFEAKGAHTINDKGTPGFSTDQNRVAIAFVWLGMPGDKLNRHAVEAMVQARAAAIEVEILTKTYDDVPHSLVAPKDCPTGELRNRLPELNRLGLAAVTAATPGPTPRWDDIFTSARLVRARAEQIIASAPKSAAAADARLVLEHVNAVMPIARKRSTKF